MKTISTSYFKTNFGTLLKTLAHTNDSFIITRYGQPIARILPIAPDNTAQENPLKNSIIFEKDIISPIWPI